MKRNFTALMAAVLVASIVSTPAMAQETPAAPIVEITQEAGTIDLAQEIPDSSLRAAVFEALNGQAELDGTPVTQDALDKITYLATSNQGISTLRGIELLRKLKILNCSGNDLTILEGVEQLKDLEVLDCSNNKLVELNLAGNKKLKTLDCSNNNLTTLDLSQNINLENLTAGGDGLTTLLPPGIEKPDPVKQVEMARLYNPNSGEHFYTADEAEKADLLKRGWQDEGLGWIAPDKTDLPVYRLYNPNAGDHHYTMSTEERDALKSLGWKDEGIGWYSMEEKSGVPIYRSYNPNATKAGAHHYTSSIAEQNQLSILGWKDEGIAWYGQK
ncbi:leucine-rich repeat domain-containing protein [Allobaculum sp. JKK-2023]|uniref:leucine-rich repeat domain-containing protein n=1 Tax=Allobaculum sp. JKK-2023 TaxID=3108943 RepID=UPI002B059C76|nr:leucine-rich repeat domain-containing protein [Allobaculum sp. JKK-2023]